MSQKKYKTKINILQNVTIQPCVQQANNTRKRRMTSSMYFLDEEPAYTDSESELSTSTEIPETESGIAKFLEIKTPVYSKNQILEHIKIIPEKRFSDTGVQCDILSTKDKLKEIIQMCASLEATGEYKELISVCKNLNNRIDHNHHDVYKENQKIIESPAVCSPSRNGKTTIKKVGLRKTITSAKQVAGVRKSYRNQKTSKVPKSHLKPIRTVEDDSSTNMESPDSGQFDWGTQEFLKPQQLPSNAIKSLARNWMKPNKSFSVLEQSICHQNYLSLQHRSTRRLYSPSQWLDSEDFVNSCR